MVTNETKTIDRNVFENVNECYKADMGRFDIKDCYADQRFDKTKFDGKCRCIYCQATFNPFTDASLKSISEWVWDDEGKEPQKDYEITCPGCGENLHFTIYIGKEAPKRMAFIAQVSEGKKKPFKKKAGYN